MRSTRCVQRELLGEALLGGELLGVVAQDDGARVGDRVDRVAHAVDEAGPVERLLVEQAVQVVRDLLVVLPVGEVLAQVVEHADDLEVRAAVARALERAERRRDRRVGVGAGRRDDVRGERRVVAAAVLGVQHERHVEDERLELGELAVGAQHVQEVLGGRVLGLGPVDDEALAVELVEVGLVGVDGEHRELRDEVQALAQHVAGRGVVCPAGRACRGRARRASSRS